MESAFAIVAEPNRRALLDLLATSEQSVGELQRRLRDIHTLTQHASVQESVFASAGAELLGQGPTFGV